MPHFWLWKKEGDWGLCFPSESCRSRGTLSLVPGCVCMCVCAPLCACVHACARLTLLQGAERRLPGGPPFQPRTLFSR